VSIHQRYKSWSWPRSRVGRERTSDAGSLVSIVHGGCLPSAEAGPTAVLAALARWHCSTDDRRPLAVASWSIAQAERCWLVALTSADCDVAASTAPALARISNSAQCFASSALTAVDTTAPTYLTARRHQRRHVMSPQWSTYGACRMPASLPPSAGHGCPHMTTLTSGASAER
jgi:hypothetical protein